MGSLLFHAIDLLPRLYKEQFNDKRQAEERAAKRKNIKYSGEQLYQLLLDFLEGKTAQFREYCPDTLIQKSRFVHGHNTKKCYSFNHIFL